MEFNSIDFGVFLALVFLLYWFVLNKNSSRQNLLLAVASAVFYGWWNWKFLSLLFISSGIGFIAGIALSSRSSKTERKAILTVGILAHLSLLGFFKYFNFFIHNVARGFQFLGLDIQINHLQILLPVGISFFTFQSISYLIDVYRRQVQATKDPIAFFAFVAFFPQLVAGPIERASRLMPQMTKLRKFDSASAIDGARLLLWGLFKKVVVADNCALIVNQIFDSADRYNGSTLFLGALFFSFQIYGDFSGYSDMAIGIARLFGINLMRNFAFPYFTQNMADFWKRWHISLSTWFRDYIYIPLGGSRRGTMLTIRNVFLVFLLSGLWHGANWTFVLWGLVHAILLVSYIIFKERYPAMENKPELSAGISRIREGLSIGGTFFLTTLTWVLFRADNIHVAKDIFQKILSFSLLETPDMPNLPVVIMPFIMILFLVSVEWISRKKEHALEFLGTAWPRTLRWGFYCIILTCIYFFGGPKQDFIYFQF
jgi:D-alanyl-lipoteichoic acid acyltransferase DltB (MBOAT superfamily)